MTSPQQNVPLVFIHIGRTGGTTLRRIAARQFTDARCLHLANYAALSELATMPREAQARLGFIEAHLGFDYDSIVTGPVNYLTWLREPIARVVSNYYYMRNTPEHTHYPTIRQNNLTLAQYITERVSKFGGDNGMTRSLCGLPNLANDVPFGECTVEMLEKAKHNLERRITVFGLLEQFDEGLMLLQQMFRWRMPVYTVENAGKANKATRTPDAETRALIAKQNALDIELYEFARELFQQRVRAAQPMLALRLRVFRRLNRKYQQNPNALKEIRRFEAKRWVRALGWSY